MAWLIRATLQSSNQSGTLTRVIGPTQNGRQEMHTRNKLKKACLEEAGQWFSQANVTPLLQQPILKQFGKIGTNWPAFKKALAGKLSLEAQEDPYVNKLIHALQRPPHIMDIPQRSLQEYTDGWRKAQEATSSSLSGIHFGHYMAGTFNPEILIFNATMGWQEGLNIMLKKSPGNFNVEKLWIILLFEAEFNVNNKWISQAVMRYTELLNLLAEEQYRSPETQGSSTSMPQQRTILWHVKTREIPSSAMLKQC